MPPQQRPSGALSADDLLDLLVEGEVEVKGRMPWSSNATFLVEVTAGERSTHGVYKPARGERPLWDFPLGLGRREVAAWLVSEALGWGLVPTTQASSTGSWSSTSTSADGGLGRSAKSPAT